MDGPEKEQMTVSHTNYVTGFIPQYIITIKLAYWWSGFIVFIHVCIHCSVGLNVVVISAINDCLVFLLWVIGARCFSLLWFRTHSRTAVCRLYHVLHTIISIFTNRFSSLHFMSVVPHSCACIATLLCPVFIHPSISSSCILTGVAMCVNEAIVAAQIDHHLTLLPLSSALPLL